MYKGISKQNVIGQLVRVETSEVSKNEVQLLAGRTKAQLLKILRPYNKDLKKYLQHAEYPAEYEDIPSSSANHSRKLFSADEIFAFLTDANCLPLEKLVILASIMGRTLVVRIIGVRNAQIPLHCNNAANAYISQLWLSIYGLLPLLQYGFEKCEHSTDSEEEEEGNTQHAMSHNSSVTDCGSIESVLAAAQYYGFRIGIDFRRPREASE